MDKLRNLNKTTRSNLITYAIVVASFVIMQGLVLAGAISNSLTGLLVPICAYICMAEGLEHTPPLTASLISTIEPVLNPILAAIVIGEKLGPTALTGAAIVVIGILAYNILKIRFPAAAQEE